MSHQPNPFTSIDNDLLADVQGGCGKKKRRCCGCNITNVVNNYAAAPAPAAPAPSGTSVDVSVGYAGASGATANYSYTG